jgi:uncharacterized cupin superfamily protein
VRAHERLTLIDPESGVERYSLAPEMQRRGLELVTYVLPPGQSSGEMAPNRHGIVEHVAVLRGKLTLLLGGAAQELTAGDGATYDPQVAVEYRNAGRVACEFLLLSDSTRAGR